MPDVEGEHVEIVCICGQSHSQLGKFITLDEPATALNRNTGQRNWGNRTGRPLARSVRPTSHAHSERAEARKRLLVNKRVNRHAGRMNTEKLLGNRSAQVHLRSDGLAPYRIGNHRRVKPLRVLALNFTTRIKARRNGC